MNTNKNAKRLDTKLKKELQKEMTLRKKAEEERDTIAREFSNTFDSLTDFFFIQDTNFTILRANKSFINALGLSREEIIGKKCYTLRHNSVSLWHCCPFQKTKKDLKPHTEEINDPYIGYPLLVTTSPLFSPSGEFVGSVHLATNITKQKEVEKNF